MRSSPLLPLLSLFSLLLLLLLDVSPCLAATLHFAPQTTAAPFSRRSHVNVEAVARSLTWLKANGESVTASNTLVLQGNDNAVENDVWISSDQGRSWDLISGVSRVNGGTFPAPSGYDTQSYRPAATAVGFTTDTQGRIYRISGQTSDPLTLGTCVSNVWMSTNGRTWEDQNARAGANAPPGRKFANAITDSTDRIFLLGGQTCDWTQLYDLWSSVDQGRSWTAVNTALPISGPIAGIFLNVPVTARANLGISEALIYTTGWDGNSDYNDVFVSTNKGTTWTVLNRGAAFTNRDDANGEVTRDGLIVVMGGKRETIVGGQRREEVLNDVWVSGDGGYSWNLCAIDAEWDDRRYQASALDSAGYLYVVGGLGPGENTQANRKNDVWRSTISFHDLPAVEAACGMTRPACGYGLTCLPTDTSTIPLSRGVTCRAIQDCGGAAGETSLDFRPQTTRALWSPRAAPYVARMQQPVTYTTNNAARATVTTPANSFVLHGTESYQENDVWISTDRMQTWSIIAGVSINGFNFGGRAASPADTTSFSPSTYGGAYGVDRNNRLYRVSGEASSGCSTDVWVSTGGVTWTRFPQPSAFAGRVWAQLVISPSDDSVTLFGGRTCAGESQFDVWRSANYGQSWSRVSDGTFSAAGPRNGMSGIYRSPVLNREIISYAGGWDGNTDYNDVQASSDGGATWATVTTAANWQRRDDIAGLVTPEGILVMVGGKTATATGEIFHNDIWVSMDGGYSWGQCSENLAFTDRRYEGITLDELGYLYVVAGETNERNPREYLNDAWRSTFSFTNFAAVAASCGVTVPACGPGLNCWPTASGTNRLPGNRGVTCPACTSTAQVPPLDFVRQTPNALWSPRSHGNIELYRKTIAYTPVGSTAQVTVTNALVMQGTNNGVENDVWVSTTHGVSWALVSGISMYGRSGVVRATAPMDTRSFTPVTSYAAFALDSKNGIIYRVGGQNSQAQNCYPGVIYSSDGKTWNVKNNNAFGPAREYAAAITDSNGYLYVSGGRNCAAGTGLTDLWRSTDQGQTWTGRNTNVPFGPRLVHLLLNHRQPNKLGGANVLMVLGGWTGSADRNDIWASSDGGNAWQLITLGAGWDSRDDMNGEITDAGLLIVSGGKTERPGVPDEFHNDVWVSADGGYSWGQCIKDASFSDRRYQMTVLDEQGYLIVAAGDVVNGGLVNDVWRSSISFNNEADVVRACGISIPSCGVGLACLPNSPGFKRLPGNRGVSCAACVNNNYGSSFDFQRLSGSAGWSARSHGHVELMRKRVIWTDQAGLPKTSTGNSLILQGNANFEENDVWISTDHGLVWELIAGRSLRGRTGAASARPAANAASSFSPVAFAPAYAQDSTGGIYRIQGQPSNGAATCTTDIWYTSNGVSWTNQYRAPGSTSIGRITPTRRYAAAVGDSQGRIFVSGGTACGANVGLNDVWMTTNKGVEWTMQVSRAPWSGRLVHAMLSLYSTRMMKNALVILTGWSGSSDSNDVWASSDDGRSWRQLTAAALWSPRDDSNAEVTSKGLIIVTSGKTDQPLEIHNDVWVSADGGYSWGRCLQDAAFTDRRYQMTVLDEADYLYVIGGDQSDRNVNDVWRSSVSFNDPNAVQAACGVRQPVCGYGLNCWYNSPGFQFRTADRGGVTCAACTTEPPLPTPTGESEFSSSTGTTSTSIVSGLTTGAVLAIIILVAVALVGLYFAYKYWTGIGAQKPAEGATGGTELSETLLEGGTAGNSAAGETDGTTNGTTNGTHAESASTK